MVEIISLPRREAAESHREILKASGKTFVVADEVYNRDGLYNALDDIEANNEDPPDLLICDWDRFSWILSDRRYQDDRFFFLRETPMIIVSRNTYDNLPDDMMRGANIIGTLNPHGQHEEDSYLRVVNAFYAAQYKNKGGIVTRESFLAALSDGDRRRTTLDAPQPPRGKDFLPKQGS